MTHRATIRRLQKLAAPNLPEDPGQAARHAARTFWVHDIIAALKAAQKRADDAWMALIAGLPEDAEDGAEEALPDPPEQAVVDALWEQVNAVVEHDRWPRELYFGGVPRRPLP